MCGIFAVFGNFRKEQQTIMKAGRNNSKRGPDNCSTIIKNNAMYMFHRLAINDVSNNGNQPMVSNDIIMMANAEIYNYKNLISTYNLESKSSSDCEVILRLYEQIGFSQMVRQLHGVYAIILTDKESKKIYFARDRIGVRPLYYGFSSDYQIFALCSTPDILTEFCTYIQPVIPGCSILVDISKPNPTWTFEKLDELELNLAINRISNPTSKIRETLEEAVKMRLMSDRPMGCLLSGGLDSSIIASILVKFLKGENVRTYSIGMEGSTDLEYARKVASFLGTKHHEVIFTYQEGLQAIPEVIKTLATYDITTIRASVGMYLLAKYIATKTTDKVIFSGEGSDEIFEGYLYFHNAPNENEAENDSLRLIKELHIYDVLRADRCISSNGLEPRVPFLDKNVVDLSLSLLASDKWPNNPEKKGCEKYLLRKAFEGYLPDEVLWRQKEAFSDGVSSKAKSWFQYIQEFVETKISNEMFNPKFPSKEAHYYKMVFDHYYPNYDLKIDYWLPRWSLVKDPSARLLKAYEK